MDRDLFNALIKLNHVESLARSLIFHGVPEEVVVEALHDGNHEYLEKLHNSLEWVSDDIEF